jgi:hypothetical protein
MTDYVLTGLVKRRAEITGDIESLHVRLKGLLTALEALDATILQFDPQHRVEAIRPRALRPPSDWSNRGQMPRMVLSLLRQATQPMTTRDLAMEMLVARALDQDDQKLFRLMTKRVGVALCTQRDNGTVRSLPGPGQFVLWEVAR